MLKLVNAVWTVLMFVLTSVAAGSGQWLAAICFTLLAIAMSCHILVLMAKE